MSSLLTLFTSSGLVDLAIKSAAVMLVALVAALLLFRASAAWRHLVWSLSVASLLLLPALSLMLPAWRVSWLPQWPSETAQHNATAPTTVGQPDRIEPLPMVPATVTDAPVTISAAPAAGHLPSAESVEMTQPARGPFPWLALGWMTGGLLSLLPLAFGLWQLAAVHRRSRELDDRRWLSLLAALQKQLAVRRAVQLRQSTEALLPLTWGALHPVLLVPDEASEWSDERRRLVLLHELAHIRRWDWLTQLVAHMTCALYWFNPLVWLAARQMRIERERACDDLVLASGVRGSDYAQELLALATGLSSSRLSTLVAVPMARRGALEDRLRGILDIRRSRAALTTTAVCLGAVLSVAANTPLAMLRAAPPQPSELAAKSQPHDDPPKADTPTEEKPTPGKPSDAKSAADKPAQRDPTPEELEARSKGIRLSVLNSKGDRGIPEFRVIAGVDSGGVSSAFEKRTGKTVINWQPHTCRAGKEGDFVWPLDRAYPEMALRVEADGYQPQVITGVKKANGVQHIVFMLTEDKGVAGRVQTPDGKPAASATVALTLPHQDIVWEGGKLRGADLPLPEKLGNRWQRPRFTKSDEEGRFQLPTEFEPAAVLVIHESGVLEMAYDAWQKSPEITLQRWGSIAGQVLWQDTPGANEEVTLTVHRDEYGYPGMIASYEKTQTNKDGTFTFDRVLPGLVQISRPIKTSGATNISAVVLNGMFQHVKVAAGDPTRIVLGGQGRKVTGKFVGLDSWEGATYHFHPEAPHVGFGGRDESWEAFGQLKASSIGPMLFRDKQPINKDGTFVIERMLPGHYQLFVTAPGFTNRVVYSRVDVAPEVAGEKPAPLDLKEIPATNKTPAAAQGPADKETKKTVEKAAEKSAEKKPAAAPAAKTTTIRGKVLDDVTGEPIGKIVIQGGMFESGDPKKVTWGYSEGRSSARDGSFSTTIRWSDGWTARIVADGYVPQPILSAAPPADKNEIEVVIRLKRGPKVRGVVLDHLGKPLKDAAVFAIGPTGLNLAAGHAVESEAEPVRTDAEGHFELPIGEAKSLAVSHAAFDAWPAAIPAEGELTIRLPQPARLDIDLAIDGADKESVIFFQLLAESRTEFKGLRLEREVKMANPGKLSLAALPPGRYQLCRNVMNHLGEIGITGMLDREFFEIKAGETKSINFVRDKGARVRGKVTRPADTKLMGTVIYVRSEKAVKSPFDGHEWTTTHASTVAADGAFQTERVVPGKYLLVAEAYTPLTQEQRFRTGFIGPSYHAEMKIEVPASGELVVDDLVLKSSKVNE